MARFAPQERVDELQDLSGKVFVVTGTVVVFAFPFGLLVLLLLHAVYAWLSGRARCHHPIVLYKKSCTSRLCRAQD